jgi:hypothetical protein
MIKRLLFLSACLCWNDVVSQHLPTGAIPTYYNGGFAGEAGAPRVSSFSYVDYFKRLDEYNYGVILSGDVFLKAIRSGVSITVGQVETERQFDSSTKFARVSISPKFSFRGKYTFAPFIDGRYSATRVDDVVRLYIRKYDLGPGYWLNPTFKYDVVLIRGGFLFNSSKAYLGLSFDLLRPVLENYFTDEELNIDLSNKKFSALLQIGYTFQNNPKSKFSFTPQLTLRHNTNELDMGRNEPFEREGVFVSDISLMVRYKKFIAGLNTSSEGFKFFDLFASPNFALGFQNPNWKIQLNQNFGRFSYFAVNSSRLNYIASLGARYTFVRKDPKGRPIQLQ